MASTYELWQKLSHKPLGKIAFSTAVSLKAPYFRTVAPRIVELRPGYAQVRLPKWWGVNNHIGTFHVIAALNGAEIAMGVLAEASVPATHRWIPQGMRAAYPAKSTGGLTVTATADLPDFPAITRESGGKAMPVKFTAVDKTGTTVVEGEIDIWISAKKPKN